MGILSTKITTTTNIEYTTNSLSISIHTRARLAKAERSLILRFTAQSKIFCFCWERTSELSRDFIRESFLEIFGLAESLTAGGLASR